MPAWLEKTNTSFLSLKTMVMDREADAHKRLGNFLRNEKDRNGEQGDPNCAELLPFERQHGNKPGGADKGKDWPQDERAARGTADTDEATRQTANTR